MAPAKKAQAPAKKAQKPQEKASSKPVDRPLKWYEWIVVIFLAVCAGLSVMSTPWIMR